MSDEPEDGDEELGELEIADPTVSQFYEVENGYIIFPHGEEWFAECYDASAIRITMKAPGGIEIMDAQSGAWRKPSQGVKSAHLTSIKGEK